jgi:two-component system response regulator AtoC
MARFSALLVDDDPMFRDSLGLLMAREGYDVRGVGSLVEARARLAESYPDVILVDLNLPDGDGTELLRDEQIAAMCDFVVITGNATVDSAVQAMREGALSYLTKPLDRSRLTSVLASVSRTREFKAEVGSLRGELRQLGRFGAMVGRSPTMQHVYDLITRVAPTQATVLLSGESGTGKELAAQTIHQLSRRRDGPFLAVNCGAVVKTLIESELFGHEKGSFTGAEASRRGYFERAGGGTLFLDEVSEMPVGLQVRLLRVLETGVILRVGASDAIPVDVRVIAATNRDPAKAVRDGILREDLYYRLNVFPISMPPLRERVDDIEMLADLFLDAVNVRDGTRKQWSPEARIKLSACRWPGNVRELKNAVERAAILADTTIGADLLPVRGDGKLAGSPTSAPLLQIRVGSSLEAAERRLIQATLEELGGDKKRAAETLGISLKTLYSRLSLYQATNVANAPDHEGSSPGVL